MKSQLRNVEHGQLHYQCLAFICPGCQRGGSDGPIGSGLHMLPVNTTVKSPSWEWDGNLEAPTISPSILTHSGPEDNQSVCHSFLKEGIFEFLNDCTHSLKGQRVPIPDLPDWVVKEGH